MIVFKLIKWIILLPFLPIIALWKRSGKENWESIDVHLGDGHSKGISPGCVRVIGVAVVAGGVYWLIAKFLVMPVIEKVKGESVELNVPMIVITVFILLCLLFRSLKK